jgi:heme exporter protein C
MQVARELARVGEAARGARLVPAELAGLSPGQRVVAGLAALTAVSMLASLWMALVAAPVDAVQGTPFRIFYFHVPIAWVAFLAFFVVFAASVAYLWRRDERWDWLARAAAEVGAVFTTLVLITGSLWGRTIWGTWWTWDPRLTTTLILWFIYVGYLMLRSYTGRTASGARAAAVLGILGFVDVPIDYLSVTWWRSIHPPASYVQSGLPPAAVTTLLLALTSFTLLFALLLVLVYHLQRVQAGAERLAGRAAAEFDTGE